LRGKESDSAISVKFIPIFSAKMHLLLSSVEGRAARWKVAASFVKKTELSVAGTDRIQTIIESSKRRSDALHEDLASRLVAENI